MFELWLFTTDENLARRAAAAGIDGFIVDWEWVDKEERQRLADLECNRDTLADLIRIRSATTAKTICRINAYSELTHFEVDNAVAAGADIIMLPMARSAGEIAAFIEIIGGRVSAGALIETEEAVMDTVAISKLPLDYVYVGLNDLALSRGSSSIFASIADGTVERLRHAFINPKFGFGGVTVVDGGYPIPFELLLREMNRLHSDFGFLRRSFKRDIIGRDLVTETALIKTDFERLLLRTESECQADRRELIRFLAKTDDLSADNKQVTRGILGG